MHVDGSKGAGLIGVVRELQFLPLYNLLGIPHEMGHLGVSFEELRNSVDDCTSHIIFPISKAPICNTLACFSTRRTSLGFFHEELFDRVVIDHRHRIAALPLYRAVDTRRQDSAKFGGPCCVSDLWLSWEEADETFFAAGKLDPFLRKCNC